MRRKVVYYGALGVVSEPHVLKLHLAAYFFKFGNGRVGRKLLFVQELEHPLARRRRALHAVHALRYLRKRICKQPNVYHERNYRAYKTGAVLNGEHAAHHAHSHEPEVSHKVHKRHHESRQKLRFPTAGIQLAVYLVESPLRLLFAAEHLYHVVPRIYLLNVSVDCAEVALLRQKVLLRLRHNKHHKAEADYRCAYYR